MAASQGQLGADLLRAVGSQGACRSSRTDCGAARPPRLAGGRSGGASGFSELPAEHLAFRASAAAARLPLEDASGMLGARKPAAARPRLAGLMAPSIGLIDGSSSGEANALLSAVRAAITPILQRSGIDPDSEDAEAVALSPGLAKELIAALPNPRDIFGGAVIDRGAPIVSQLAAARTSLKSCAAAGSAPTAGGIVGTSGRSGRPTSQLFYGFSPARTSGEADGTDMSADDPWAVDTTFWGGLPGPTFGCPPTGEGVSEHDCDTSFISTVSNCSGTEASAICKAAEFLQDQASEISGISGELLDYATLLPDAARRSTAFCAHSTADAPHGSATNISNFAANFHDAPDVVEVYPPFFDIGIAEDIIGGDELRAGILLHEMVHGVDATAASFGSAIAWLIALILSGSSDAVDVTGTLPDLFGRAKSCDVPDTSPCTSDPGTEWRAAFIQAKFYGMGDCGAELFACSYVRQVCKMDADERLWKAALEVAECYLGITSVLLVAAVVVLITAVGILSQGALVAAVEWLFAGTAVIALLALLYIVLIDETAIG